MKCPKCQHEWSTATEKGNAARRANAKLGGRPKGAKNKPKVAPETEPTAEEAVSQ